MPKDEEFGFDDTLGVDDTLAASEAMAGDVAGLVRVDSAHYALGEEIARGGMGRILRARDLRLGRTVAIKELLRQDSALERRFEREMRITARLQHPAIISIHEAGRWPSGVPFFAMKYVEGKPLDEAIESLPTVKERLSLLPNVIACADALAFAHDRQVIHRDLKPANVLVGDFGETVVIDWGLAKDMSSQEDSDGLDADAHVPADADLTVVGQAMGTPAYMSPKQARGEPLDEQTDVYAIGAMLYHLIAGAPPYAGARSVQELLERVRSVAPRSLRELEPDTPEDLIAIVETAMNRDTSLRYPNAKKLSRDLKRFETGKLVSAHTYSVGTLLKRWMRRRRAAIAVAVVMLVVLAVGGLVSVNRISRERDSSERRRVQLEEMLDFMVGDLKNKLAPIAKLELLESVAVTAVDYYAEQPVDWSNPEEVRHRSSALGNVADIQIARGDLSMAHDTLLVARDLSEELVRRDPLNITWLQHLSEICSQQGHTFRAQRNTSKALASFERSLKASQNIVDIEPNHPEGRHSLALGHSNLGDLHRASGNLDEAVIHYRRALSIAEGLVASQPSLPRWQRLQAIGYDKIGDTLLARGNAMKALDSFEASLRIRAGLVRSNPEDTNWQRDLSVSHERIGDIQITQKRFDAAEASFRAAAAIAEALSESDPTNTLWLRDRTVVADKLAGFFREQGNIDAALEMAKRSMTIRERLTAMDPTNESWRRDLAYSYGTIGALLLGQDREDAAREFLGKCAATFSAQPSGVDDYYNAMGCYALMGETDTAFAWLSKTLEQGWQDFEALQNDPDLTSLHSDPRWNAILGKALESRKP